MSASPADSAVPADTSSSSGRYSRSACSGSSPPSSRRADCGACRGAGTDSAKKSNLEWPAQEQIRYYCKKDEQLRQSVAWLKSLPGIGEIIATHLVARLGDPELVTNVRQIAGFLALVSSEHSTGDKQNRRAITRAGDYRLRNC